MKSLTNENLCAIMIVNFTNLTLELLCAIDISGDEGGKW